MVTRREHGSPYLQAAVLEVVENQMRDNDPPETRQTYDCLIDGGHSEGEAKRLIGCVVASEIFGILKRRQAFNLQRFVRALHKLPAMPKD